MGYMRAEEILPVEIIELIQRYVDGESIYIPRKPSHRKAWGAGTKIKQELLDRCFSEEVGVGMLAGRQWCLIFSHIRFLKRQEKRLGG